MTPSLVCRAHLGVVLAALAVGLGACGSQPKAGALATGPTALAQLEGQGSRVVGGGTRAFRAQLAALKGHPVVVNQWASWCGPCRYEFPFLRRLAGAYRGKVAFLGVDAQDNRSDAEAFLRRMPVPYPSFFDESADAARTFKGGQSWPTTAFYDSAGRLAFTHLGAYATQAKLDTDIRRFARPAG
jgi:cytochrome c biogenesis protein CcmG/thiol:disulfide interchange protein DsbE